MSNSKRLSVLAIRRPSAFAAEFFLVSATMSLVSDGLIRSVAPSSWARSSFTGGNRSTPDYLSNAPSAWPPWGADNPTPPQAEDDDRVPGLWLEHVRDGTQGKEKRR